MEHNNGNDKKIVLNVYELAMTPDQQQQEQQQQQSSSASIISFFSRILPHAGLGAYHTSLDVNGYCYTYGMGGISKTTIANKHNHIPPSATFIESIILGSLNLCIADTDNDLSMIHTCINNLRQKSFTETGYHVLHRNCNHFTETFATALIIAHDLLRDRPPELKSYPKWINRLARSSSTFLTNHVPKNTINNNDNISASPAPISPCNVMEEARIAAGLDGKIGWDLTSSSSAATSSTAKHSMKDNRGKGKQKKELTEAQKKILGKLKPSKSLFN